MKRFIHNIRLRQAPYDKSRNYDIILSKFVKQVREEITTTNDDDYLVIIVGPPRSGKSNLGLHIYEEYDPDNCDAKFIAQNRPKFADALKLVKEKSSLRFLDYDEANINKREALSKWNKAMMDLYFAIGGLNIFHIWCNPSLEMIDKPFIEERVKAVILVYDKSPGKRVYFFFKTPTILRILENHGDLKLRTLIKNRKRAYYKGWFREYNGKLKEAYLKDKAQGMSDKVDNFHQEWGTKLEDGTVARSAMADRLGISDKTIERYEKELLHEGKLQTGVNFHVSPTGRKFYNDEVYDLMIAKASEKRMNQWN